MQDRMTRWGVGPVFAGVSAVYGAGVLWLGERLGPVAAIPFLPGALRVATGWALICVGAALYLAAIVAAMRAYAGRRLVTGHVYALCRHPAYAAWAVLIVPGSMCLLDSWPGLSVPVFMCVLLRIVVRKEERLLEAAFGEAYRAYCRKVPPVLPLGRLLSFRRQQG